MPPKKNDDDFLEVLRKLAHMLSQPLTSLCGSVEVALMGECDKSECRQVLELALQESHRMAGSLEMLRELLDIEGSGEELRPVCWSRSVERSLEEAASIHRGGGLQLVSSLKDEVWVNGIPQQLGTATRRLIRATIESCHGKHVVRVGLSVGDETACLSVCADSLNADTRPILRRERPQLPTEASAHGVLDWLIVRRAAERLGGGFKVDEVSDTCRCYRLTLPLAPSKVAGQC